MQYNVCCRSGKYVYKPTMNVTCCPQYPVRCEVANLRLTKSQKRVVKLVNKYLSTGECHAMTSADPERHGHEESSTAAAAGCQMVKDDVKPHGTECSTSYTGSTSDATAVGSLSTKTVSSAGCDKKAMHRIPKPGLCLLFYRIAIYFTIAFWSLALSCINFSRYILRCTVVISTHVSSSECCHVSCTFFR